MLNNLELSIKNINNNLASFKREYDEIMYMLENLIDNTQYCKDSKIKEDVMKIKKIYADYYKLTKDASENANRIMFEYVSSTRKNIKMLSEDIKRNVEIE